MGRKHKMSAQQIQRVPKIKIVKHYCKDDTDCSMDYSDVELFVDDKLVMEWPDHYHDDMTSYEGFLLGYFKGLDLKLDYSKNVEEIDIADREW